MATKILQMALLMAFFAVHFGCSGFSRSAYSEGVDRQAEGDLQGAAARYREALLDQPDNIRAHYNLGYVYQDLANQAQSADLIQDAANYRLAARGHYEHILRLSPGHGPALSGLAWLLVDAGDEAAALKLLSDTPIADEDGQMAAWTTRAALERRAGRNDESLKTLRMALDRDPYYPPASAAYADLAKSAGQRAEARAVLEKTREIHRFDLGLLLQAAELALEESEGAAGSEFSMERRVEAHTLFHQALVLEENNRRAAFGLAKIAEAEGRVEEAVRLYWDARDAAGSADFADGAAGLAEFLQVVDMRLKALYPRLGQEPDLVMGPGN